MKKNTQVFIVLIFISVSNFAQSNNYKFNMKMTIEVPDTQSVILNYMGTPDNAIEGYYLQPRYKNVYTPNAALQKGGFNFLDDNIFGGIVESLSKKWIKNKFPITDVASMSNGFSPAKVLSFQIKPVLIDGKADTLNLFVKYALIDYWSNRESNLDFTSHIHLYYKWLRVKYNEKFELKIFNKLFDKHKFIVKFWKGKDKVYTIKNNNRLFEAIKESAENSETHNVNLSFDIKFIRTDVMNILKYKYLAKYEEINLPSTETISTNKNERIKLPVKIYYGRLKFPSILYNTKKAKLYSSYKTKDKIFQSSYDVVIVPIKMTKDSLTYDLFLNYSKLNIGDEIPRWTPIKKRITISKKWTFALVDFPKENWSANFTREGEHYDIYGYSDFEQFVDENIRIKFEVLK